MPASATNRLPAIVQFNLARLGGIGPGVIAVSGGADSVCLLRALVECSSNVPFRVAHLNHRLRGKDSDDDAEFVARLFPGLPHFFERANIENSAAESGENLEATARRMRYDFLARVAKSSDSTWVATAHTQDDQAETLLHRLIRGSGIRGLRGIAESRELVPGIRLLRPMLSIARTEAIEFLNEAQQPWREDATNRDVAFTRNRIRHEVLPLLKEFNPRITGALARVAEQSNEVFEKIKADIAAVLAVAVLPAAGRIVVLDSEYLLNHSDFVVRELLNRIWEGEGWPRGGMTHEHWQRAAEIVRGRARAGDFPDGIRMASRGKIVQMGPADAFTSRTAP